jgi:pyridoxamine 5'-phosphate oxidase
MSFAKALSERDADPDPIAQFHRWFAEAGPAGVRMPEAAVVATASADGAPSARMVLVKRVDHEGFVFFTNYESRKGSELSANPRGALLFYWDPLGRQVRVEGPAARLDPDHSAEYIRSRPRGSQISALASPQSRPIENRARLEEAVAELARRYEDRELPIPAHWGGFRIRPERIEFWQHREDRLHDRLLYTPADNGAWRIERLAP